MAEMSLKKTSSRSDLTINIYSLGQKSKRRLGKTQIRREIEKATPFVGGGFNPEFPLRGPRTMKINKPCRDKLG